MNRLYLFHRREHLAVPTVSIVVPAYNPGLFLQAAVQSVVQQTFTDWEMVIVDDGSVNAIASSNFADPRIKVIRQERSGSAAARNNAILNSTGEFVALLDADDLWIPSKLEKQIAFMRKNTQVHFLYSDFLTIDENGTELPKRLHGKAETYEELLKGSFICTSSVVMRRDVFAFTGLFDPFYRRCQDVDIFLKMARHRKLSLMPECLAAYRQHPNQITKAFYEEAYLNSVEMLLRHARIESNHNAARRKAIGIGLQDLRRTYGCQAFDHCRSSWRKGDYKNVLHHLWCSMTISCSPLLFLRAAKSFLKARAGSLAKQPTKAVAERS